MLSLKPCWPSQTRPRLHKLISQDVGEHAQRTGRSSLSSSVRGTSDPWIVCYVAILSVGIKFDGRVTQTRIDAQIASVMSRVLILQADSTRICPVRFTRTNCVGSVTWRVYSVASCTGCEQGLYSISKAATTVTVNSLCTIHYELVEYFRTMFTWNCALYCYALSPNVYKQKSTAMTLAIFTQSNGRLCFSTLMRISLSRWGCEYLKCHVYRE